MGSKKVILCFDEDEFFNWFHSLPKDVCEHTSMKIQYQKPIEDRFMIGKCISFVPVKNIQTRM